MTPSVVDDRSTRLEVGLRRLSLGLIGYGVVGLVLAVIGLGAMVYVGNRVADVAERAGDRVETLVLTVEDSATALRSAGLTANSFAATLERTPPAVRQAAATVESIRGTMLTIENQLAGITILGSSPFGGIADQFGAIATDLDGLDARLEGIATDLEDNKTRLLETGQSLTALGDRLDEVADDLGSGFIEDSFEDIRLIVMTLGLLLVVWIALPSVGALAFGIWLRRTLGDG